MTGKQAGEYEQHIGLHRARTLEIHPVAGKKALHHPGRSQMLLLLELSHPSKQSTCASMRDQPPSVRWT